MATCTEHTVYTCDECGCDYDNDDSAESCCMYECDGCGEMYRYESDCDECQCESDDDDDDDDDDESEESEQPAVIVVGEYQCDRCGMRFEEPGAAMRCFESHARA